MDCQSQNPAPLGTTSSPENGEAVGGCQATNGGSGPVPGSSSAALPSTAAEGKPTPRGKGRGSKGRDQSAGTVETNAPVGFDRVCALLAEAVIGLMADRQPSSTEPASGAAASTRGDSDQTADSGFGRSSVDLDERIVEELRQSGASSPTALRAKLFLQRTPCTKALNRLVAKGALIGEGSTRNRTYRLAPPSQSAAA